MASDAELTIWEHLYELRSRMVKVSVSLLVATAFSVVFTKQALELLIAPLGGAIPQTIKPTESFVVYFRIALLLGVTLAMPVIVYHVIRFVLPGLMPEEKKYLWFLLPGVAVCFAGGVSFAAFIMLPAAINFMQGFLSTIIDNRWTLDNYIGFVTRVLFWMGIVFQTPLLMFFLAKLNVVTAQNLARYRKYAVLGIAVIAAVVTPTPDPINMMIVMLPLYLLYEVGIVLARLATVGRRNEPDAEAQEAQEEAPAIEASEPE